METLLVLKFWNTWSTPFYNLKALNHVYRILRSLKTVLVLLPKLIYEMLGNGLREVSNHQILISHKNEELSGTQLHLLEGMRPCDRNSSTRKYCSVAEHHSSTTGYNAKGSI
jgi:predicted ATP-dependent serine protease